MTLLFVFHLAVTALLAAWVPLLLLNLWLMPRLRSVRWEPEEAPRVSVLVPARNESLNIEKCVRSLLAQDYPNFEIRVLDDHSADDTAERVRVLGLCEENGGLLKGKDLPAGWVGKNWACHQLSCAASGEYLFFTDADTIHSQGVIGGLVAAAREHQADLVSAWPRQEVVHWAEKLVVSLLPFAGALFYPHGLLWVLERYPEWRQKVPRIFRRGLGAANGQALFFSRAGYQAVGGHEALRSHLVEDVAMGRAMAQRMGEGRWWVNVDSGGMIGCRMYRSFTDVWEGFTKNARAAFEGNLWAFLLSGFGQVILMLMPFFWAVWPSAYQRWAWGEVGLILLLRSLATRFAGGSWWSVWFHPLAYGLAIAIGLNSWRRSAGSGVYWKGRLYDVNNPTELASER